MNFTEAQLPDSYKGLFKRYLLYFVLSLILSLLVFSQSLNNFFASDDWPAILRNSQFAWQELPEWFTQQRAGWYRPVHDLFIALNWHFFQLNPLGYRISSILLYALVSACVGLLMFLLAQNQRAGILSVVIFSLFSTHAEPVLWFAGTNELIAALFALISTITYVLFRKSNNNYWWLVITCVSAFLAFASKETAIFFPLLLFLYDILLFWGMENKTKQWGFFLPLVLVFAVWAGFLLFRLSMKFAYLSVVELTIQRVIANITYYLLIGVFALPNNYAFLSALPTWQSSPLLPTVILLLSVTTIGIVTAVWLVNWNQIPTISKQTLLYYGVWSFAAIGPVIFVVTERASFLSTVGIASAYAVLLIGAWDVVRKGRPRFKQAMAVVIVIFICLNLFVLTYRSAFFGRSAVANRAVISQIDAQAISAGEKVLIANLPDHTGYTFTFRNTFPSANKLMRHNFEIHSILDTRLAGMSSEQQHAYVYNVAEKINSNIIYWYSDGKLILNP